MTDEKKKERRVLAQRYLRYAATQLRTANGKIKDSERLENEGKTKEAYKRKREAEEYYAYVRTLIHTTKIEQELQYNEAHVYAILELAVSNGTQLESVERILQSEDL